MEIAWNDPLLYSLQYGDDNCQRNIQKYENIQFMKIQN